MVFLARQLPEKCREQQKPLYMGFIDLTQAFDTVKRELLWEILSRYGCPTKFIKILRLLHDNTSVTVMANGSLTEPFKVKSGVKQGCVAAPTLFSIFITVVLHLTRDKLPPGISINYRKDGGIFNPNRLKIDAVERSAWRVKVKDGIKNYEENRKHHLENRRAARQARQVHPQPPLSNNKCPNCDRACSSRIGLISHIRTHQ
ncbi:uncharacterized protein LOC135222381 [Macrobrachium nipponense]|uniref:uncharacterized protein LOC135222381 n=1 Tax=Macrobrachium nipponense TaxID=159736 RepID=UPI0030C883DA